MSSSNHHPTLYFPDGNLVIICKRDEETPTYFPVHPTIIAKHSPIFADMLTLPSPPDNQDVYDGVPFVEFPDDPNDMTTFLNFFYEPFTSLISDMDTDFALNISGVLKIADRLMVEPLMQAILTRIRLDWPSTLEEWDARQEFYFQSWYPDPAPVIQIARLYDSSLLVPTLFYELSTRDQSCGEFAVQWDLISEEDRVIAFAGRKRMLQWLSQQLSSWTSAKAWKCDNRNRKGLEQDCTEVHLRLFIETHQALISNGDILAWLKWPIGQWEYEYDPDDNDSCRPCGSAMDDRWKKIRSDIFQELPKFFIGYL